MTEIEMFKEAMSRLGSAVVIITTNGVAGLHGMTATAVCSVSAEPPTLLICVNRSSRGYDLLKSNNRFCVNILNSDQHSIAHIFSDASKTPIERFSEGSWTKDAGAPPRLIAATASISCDIISTFYQGSHSIFIGSIKNINLDGEKGNIIYLNRSFHSL